MKENVGSQNMRGKAPQKYSLSGVQWTLDLKLYSPHSPPLSQRLHFCTYSRTPLSPPAIPSTTRNPSLQHSSPLPPSQEARQHEWQAGAGGGIWGLLAKRQTGAAPLESLKWQTLKKSVWGGGAEKDENIPQDEQATEFCTFLSPFLNVPCQFFCLFFFFSVFFFFPVIRFYKFCSNV